MHRKSCQGIALQRKLCQGPPCSSLRLCAGVWQGTLNELKTAEIELAGRCCVLECPEIPLHVWNAFQDHVQRRALERVPFELQLS